MLSYDPHLAIFHQPVPSLAMQSKVVYDILLKNRWQISDNEETLMKEMFWSAREDYLRYTYKTGKRYVETNNYITFFAPVLKEVFPDALFIHLVRHPGEFVRSGINRSYYSRSQADDCKRIEPVSGSYVRRWEFMTQIEKTAWLWMETNRFIKDFLETMPADQYRVFDFNQLSGPNIDQILSFIGSKVPHGKVENLIPRKINAQQSLQMKSYDSWDEKERGSVAEIAGDLASDLGYII